jgi:hypothetical protein
MTSPDIVPPSTLVLVATTRGGFTAHRHAAATESQFIYPSRLRRPMAGMRNNHE